MARIRTIKPTFFSSLSNADLPKLTRLTWIGLWTYVDDKGRAVEDARLVKAAIWPLDDDYTTKKVAHDLDLLAAADKIRRYEHGGRRYFSVVTWRSHQRIDKPQKSILPAPPWEQEDPENDPAGFQERSRNDPGTVPPKGGGEVEGKGSGREVEGKLLDKSSSNHLSAVPVENEEEDEGSTKITKACQVIAQRRLARRQAESTKEPITMAERWLVTTAGQVRDEWAAKLAFMADQGATVAAMVNTIEPKKATKPAPMTPGYDKPFIADEPWEEPEMTTDSNGHLTVRRA